jgi:hypothetical protein
MMQFHPKPYLPVLVFLSVAASYAQFGGRVPDESRAPMSIRAVQIAENCKLSVSGNAWVGRSTVKGGGIELRDLSGVGLYAASGVLRFVFANGRYHDHVWKYQTLGSPIASARVTPKEGQFDGGLVAPLRIEGRVSGAYFADGHVCGELGKNVKMRLEQSIESARKDLQEAIEMANVMSPRAFQESVRIGLLRGGPYARETVDATNALLKAKLIGPDGKLIKEYKQWLSLRQNALKPATPLRPKRSSLQPAP